MNLSVNGHSQVPPGFRFHPTEEELLQYYLKKKVANQKIDLDVIQDIDLNKLEPWDIQEKCRIGSGPQTDWYFFSHKDKKYPTGSRTNRATAAGFWKATGRDKVICSSSSRIGMRKTLVFYKGRAPHGEKSDWIMHEYRLDDNSLDSNVSNMINGDQQGAAEEGWVVCRVFRKKNYVKAHDHSPTNQASPTSIHLKNTHDLDQILSHKTNSLESFMHLPQLETPVDHPNEMMMMVNYGADSGSAAWAELDRLVACQLNGQPTAEAKQLSCFKSDSHGDNSITPFYLLGETDASDNHTATANDDVDVDDQFWSFTKQSSSSTSLDPILHFAV